jgi:CheY-like chemotaxis protein
VLVVDDDQSHRQVIRALLAPLGFEVVDIGNSLEVLGTLEQLRPDLLLDVSMPGLNGWQVLEQVRARKVALPVIMVSADAQEGRHDPDAPRLHDDYIIKPVRLNALLAALARIGHRKGLLEALHDLKRHNQADARFISELERLTHDFQFELILGLLEEANHELS